MFELNLVQVPGVHDPLDPEYSILKQRLARRARYEKVDVSKLDLVAITKLAERTISNDLEFLAEKAVNIDKANYAIVTGVQVSFYTYILTPPMFYATPSSSLRLSCLSAFQPAVSCSAAET